MPGTREIGALVVEMRADATKFVRGMNRSERSMKETRRESSRLGKSFGVIRTGAKGLIASLATAAAGLAGVVATGTVPFGEFARDVQDISDATGINTNDVQALGRIYNQFGLELADVRTHFNDINQALGDARNGSEELRRVFARAGVDITQNTRNVLDDLLKLGPVLAANAEAGRSTLGDTDFDKLRPFLERAPELLNAARAMAVISEQNIRTLAESNRVAANLNVTAEAAAATVAATVAGLVITPPLPRPPRAGVQAPPIEPFFATADIELSRNIEDNLHEITEQARLLNLTFGETTKRIAEITSQFEINAQEREAYLEIERKITDARTKGDVIAINNLQKEKEALDATAEARAALNNQTTDARVELALLVEEQERSAQLAADLAGAIGTGIGDAVTDFENLDQVGQQFLATLIRIVAQAALIGPLERGLASGNFAGGVFDFFTARHGGVHRGLGITGEEGPELVDFSTPARVYTNEQLHGALTAGRGGVTYNISGLDETGIRRLIYEQAPVLEQGFVASISQDAGRPSYFRDRLQGRA